MTFQRTLVKHMQGKAGLAWAIGSALQRSPLERKHRSFEQARAFVHRLGLNSAAESRQFSNKGGKPKDIPSTPPSRTDANTDWSGWGDWLGTKTVATRTRIAIRYMRTSVGSGLGIWSQAEWIDYCKSGKKPDDVRTHHSVTRRRHPTPQSRDF